MLTLPTKVSNHIKDLKRLDPKALAKEVESVHEPHSWFHYPMHGKKRLMGLLSKKRAEKQKIPEQLHSHS